MSSSCLRPAHPQSTRPYRIDLTVRSQALNLDLAGSLGAEAVEPLRAVLRSMHRLGMPVRVNTREVAAAQLCGLRPLVEDADTRRARRLPPLTVDDCPARLRELFAQAGLPAAAVGGVS